MHAYIKSQSNYPSRTVCIFHKLVMSEVAISIIFSFELLLILCISVREYLGGRAGIIFLLGVPSTEKQRNSSLEDESANFGDILQGDFPDSYPHLSHKVVMSFIWTNKLVKTWFYYICL